MKNFLVILLLSLSIPFFYTSTIFSSEKNNKSTIPLEQEDISSHLQSLMKLYLSLIKENTNPDFWELKGTPNDFMEKLFFIQSRLKTYSSKLTYLSSNFEEPLRARIIEYSRVLNNLANNCDTLAEGCESFTQSQRLILKGVAEKNRLFVEIGEAGNELINALCDASFGKYKGSLSVSDFDSLISYIKEAFPKEFEKAQTFFQDAQRFNKSEKHSKELLECYAKLDPISEKVMYLLMCSASLKAN